VLKGFKDFLLRGNVVELAVAVVVGVAFNDVVMSFTDSFIQPLVKVAMGGGVSGGEVELDKDNSLKFGVFTNAVITFLITAAVVYFVFVVPIRKLIERQKREEPAAAEPPAPAEDVVLLREIRDLLAADNPKRL
jgi:large conductance mechanosensitive channel